ncbi:hypothetical protein U27_01380 [Candidatus Vecturithrix granuli]|uniref:Lipoprotein n=1 Tax=Vecturithrix granuli TaxID=1499967 RepID=A0A081CA74_VECG1|nr:hypothetical protein U27_01380 [Candidatus Vecturithrix granuli]
MQKIWCVLVLVLTGAALSACVQVSSYNHDYSVDLFSNLHEPHTYLQNYLNFSQRELESMEQGEVVVKVFDMGGSENEVGAFGVVRLNIPKQFFVEQFRDIVSFTESDAVQQIGKFSASPNLQDIQELVFESSEIEDIKRCRPGSCKLKMDTTMMERFQHEIDWKAPDYQEQATRLMQQLLVDYVNAYLTRGDAALGEYHDQTTPIRQAEAFQGLLENSSYLVHYVPELYAYLQEFPHGKLANVENFIYWSKEIFGLKPVINLFHVTIYTRERLGKTDVFITSKQIYASHYFETSLGFTAFVEETGGKGEPGSFLMYLNRSRFDQLRGKLKGVIVSLAKGRVYDGVKMYFRQVKDRLESEQVVRTFSKS